MHDATPPDPSPYRPPAWVDEREPLAEQEPEQRAAAQPPLPLWASAGFAVVSLAVHLGARGSEQATRELLGFPLQLFLPLVLLPLFTLFCVCWYSAHPLAGIRLLRGKLLIFLVLPPLSLLIFVPAFLAISLLVVVAVGYWPLLTISALAGAYFLTAVGISRWLWWWFACRR